MAPTTIVNIKTSLDFLGVTYKDTMRKSELLELLESAIENDNYSPPNTRRRKTMSIDNIKDDRPLNPAGALLEKFDEQVYVKITREVSPTKESVLEEEVAEIIESKVIESEVIENEVTESEVTESEVTESEDELVSESVIVSVIKNSPEDKIVTRSVTKRRSTRITKHTGCETALFSDEDTLDDVKEGEEEEITAISTEGKSLRKILLLSIIIVLIANLIAYLYIHKPSMVNDCYNKIRNMFVESEQASSVIQ